MEHNYERSYQAFKNAYELCLVYDEDFDDRFFHVLMENPVQPCISQAMAKICDPSLPLEPTYRKLLIDFVNRLEDLGPSEYERVEAIQRFYDENAIFNPDLTRDIALQHATHNKNGFWLSEDAKISQLADEGAYLLTRAHQLKTATRTSNHFKCCPQSYFIAVERALSRADTTMKDLQILSDLTFRYMQTNAAYFQHSSSSIAVFCQKVCSVCHGLSHVQNRPDVIRQILAIALHRQEEAERRQKAAMALRDTRAKALPGFMSDFLYERLDSMPSEQFTSLQNILFQRNITSAEDLQRLYEQTRLLQSYIGEEKLGHYIDQQKPNRTKSDSAEKERGL